jgi:multidrug resistance efflux pump
MPVQWATLSLDVGGRLEWIAPEGERVVAGDALARVDATDQEHLVAGARAALATAEAQLEAASAGAMAEEIAAAEGAVITAQGVLATAEATLAQAEANAGIAVEAAEADLAQAQGTLETAEANLAQARAELARLQADPRPEEIAIYQARLAQAEAELRLPKNIHDDLIDMGVGGTTEERARFQLEAAQAARDAAQATLELARAGASGNEIAVAWAGVSGAQAQVTVAQAGVVAAEVALAQASAAGEVAIARAEVEVAAGQLAQAEAQLDQLQAGTPPEELAVLEAQVAQAAAALAQVESVMGKTTLVAPFGGVVGERYLRPGEIVAPGAPLLVLGEVSELRVETTDLNEVDAARVAPGSPVLLTFDALPGTKTDGEITLIAPKASTDQGGTNFTAMIEMTSPPEALRWGMTAFVDIEVE